MLREGVQISNFGVTINFIWIFKVQKEPVIAFKGSYVAKSGYRFVPAHPSSVGHETAGQNMCECHLGNCQCSAMEDHMAWIILVLYIIIMSSRLQFM